MLKRLKFTLTGLRLYVGLLRPAIIFIGVLTAKGFGLLASADTGGLYLGSDWNEYPVPS